MLLTRHRYSDQTPRIKVLLYDKMHRDALTVTCSNRQAVVSKTTHEVLILQVSNG